MGELHIGKGKLGKDRLTVKVLKWECRIHCQYSLKNDRDRGQLSKLIEMRKRDWTEQKTEESRKKKAGKLDKKNE